MTDEGHQVKVMTPSGEGRGEGTTTLYIAIPVNGEGDYIEPRPEAYWLKRLLDAVRWAWGYLRRSGAIMEEG